MFKQALILLYYIKKKCSLNHIYHIFKKTDTQSKAL